MLEILGKLGLDGKMLIAQIVNFIVLLWLLNKFLYKPILQEVEKNENLLNEAQEKNKALVNEQVVFQNEKKEFLVEMKKVSQVIVNEAKKVAQTIEFNAQADVEKLKRKLIEQTKRQMTSEKNALAKKREKLLLIENQSSFVESLKQRIANWPELRVQMDAAFFDLLVQNIDYISKESEMLGGEADKLPPEFLSTLSEEQRGELKKVLKQNTEEILLGVESVAPLTDKQLEELRKVLKRQGFNENQIKTSQNADLICGYRLDIGGYLIEANLLYEIRKAYEE